LSCVHVLAACINVGCVHHSVLARSRELFAAYAAGDREAISADLLEPVFRTVVRYSADGHELEQLTQLYPNVPPAVQTAILTSLTATPDAALLSKSLAFAMSDVVRRQNILYIFRHPSLHPDVQWQWLRSEFDELHTRYVDSISLLHSVLRGVLDGITTQEELEQVEQFFADKDTAKYKAVLSQAIESARIRAAWLQRDRGAVAEWLLEHVKQ
jgi:hypothetical protein